MRYFKTFCWAAIILSVLVIMGSNEFLAYVILSLVIVLIPCLVILYLLVSFIAWAARR